MKKKANEDEDKLPSLVLSKEEARSIIQNQINDGEKILENEAKWLMSSEGYETLKTASKEWTDYNADLLLKIFDTNKISKEYRQSYGYSIPMNPSIGDLIARIFQDIKIRLDRLRSILKRIDLFQESIVSGGKESISGNQTKCVFIGHGRSPLWAIVKTYLKDELKVEVIAYETESRVGESIVPILEQMLNQATFAILVLTAEDQTAKGEARARQNVIHEAGLFQGRLGFKKAILLVQDGLEGFSNIDGLQHIPFSGSKIEQAFYELQRVLKRESIIN